MVVNQPRSAIPRIIILNTGTIRYDITRGPFTFHDSFTISPFPETFGFIPSVPYKIARQVIDVLNNMPNIPFTKDPVQNFLPRSEQNPCPNLPSRSLHSGGSLNHELMIVRQSVDTPGYNTTDDLGNDGDDTPHSPIAMFPIPTHIQTTAAFPADGREPELFDLVFMSFIRGKVVGPCSRWERTIPWKMSICTWILVSLRGTIFLLISSKHGSEACQIVLLKESEWASCGLI